MHNLFTAEEIRIAKMHHDFESCASVMELKVQLSVGLISVVEFSQAVLQVWGFHQKLPQYNRE